MGPPWFSSLDTIKHETGQKSRFKKMGSLLIRVIQDSRGETGSVQITQARISIL